MANKEEQAMNTITTDTMIKGRLDYKRKSIFVQNGVVIDRIGTQSSYGTFVVGEHFVRFRGKGKRNWIDLCETHMIVDFVPEAK
jgi:hypothetical protein